MRTSLISCAVLFVVGCGSDSSKPSPSANKDNVCDQLAAVACYDMYQCCSEGQIENYLNVSSPRTEGECNDDVRRLCEQNIGIVDESITGGRVTFDASIMNACLKALIAPDDSCSGVGTMLPWAAACMETAWVGTVAIGGSCSYRYECAGHESYCAANQTCTALPGNAAPCSPAGCATGFYCGGNNTCRAQLAQGTQCAQSRECATGLYCGNNGGGNQTCSPLQGPGQPCTGNQSCQSNQCLPGTCAGTANSCFSARDCNGRCSNDAGQQCQQDRDCGQGACSIGGAQCNTTQQCGANGGTCVFANTCIQAACVGDVVCSDSHVSVDYCTGAVDSLPQPPP